ncbi:hypothetical protein D3C73_1308970 [compost metagenome]
MQRHVLIVFAGFWIVKNGGDLLLVFRAEHEGGIVEGLLGQERQCFWFYLEDCLAFKLADADVIGCQQIVLSFVFPQRERRLVSEFNF